MLVVDSDNDFHPLKRVTYRDLLYRTLVTYLLVFFKAKDP